MHSEKAKEVSRAKKALDEKEQLQKMVRTEQEKANGSLTKVKELEEKLQGKEEEFTLREEEFHSMLQKKVKEKDIQLNEKELELTSMKKHLEDVQGLYQKLLPKNESLQAENNSLKEDCEVYEEKLNQLGKYEVDWTRDLINEELQDFGIHVNILPGDQLIFGGEYRGVNIMLNPEDKILFVQASLPKRSLSGKRLKEVKEICELENTEAMFGSFFTMNDSLYYRVYCSSFDMMKEQIDFGCEKLEKFPNIYLEPKEEIEIEP